MASAQNCSLELVYNIILDINGTLVKDVEYTKNPGPDDICLLGATFTVAVGAPELLFVLSQRPDVCISVFSAGHKKRNEPLVAEICNRAARFGCKIADMRVLSSCSLDRRMKKDLTTITEGIDLSRTLIIDDNITVPSSQERNVLLVVTHDFDKPGANVLLRQQARYHLVRAAGILARSWEIVSQDPSVPWLQAVERLQYDADHSVTGVTKHEEETYRRGLEMLNQCRRAAGDPELQIQGQAVRGAGCQCVYPWSDPAIL